MAEELQSLLARINEDGVRQAEAKRDEIIGAAQAEAEKMRAEAKAEAEKIVEKGKADSKRLHERAEHAIRQAARDVLLDLRGELERRLRNAIGEASSAALTPELMADIVGRLSKSLPEGEISIRSAVKDTKKLDAALDGVLGESFRKNGRVLGDASLSGGMEVSFTDGKVYFDFTDAALTDLISTYAGARLTELLK